mmetsp:Transcript_26410/g.68628  ORF Transcript_26410/g.68628 Transcript_26410/m.68628 type:complete len:263 (-) Transcript_26410:159-947(-)
MSPMCSASPKSHNIAGHNLAAISGDALANKSTLPGFSCKGCRYIYFSVYVLSLAVTGRNKSYKALPSFSLACGDLTRVSVAPRHLAHNFSRSGDGFDLLRVSGFILFSSQGMVHASSSKNSGHLLRSSSHKRNNHLHWHAENACKSSTTLSDASAASRATTSANIALVRSWSQPTCAAARCGRWSMPTVWWSSAATPSVTALEARKKHLVTKWKSCVGFVDNSRAAFSSASPSSSYISWSLSTSMGADEGMGATLTHVKSSG